MMAESQNIEWKESWRDEYLKWICGFANAQGGKIYIGKKDDGTVIGVSDAKKLMDGIPNKIQNKLGIVADVNLLTENGLEYIEIVVSPWAFPVNYDGEYHYRSGSTKQQLRGNALTNFLISKTGMKWESSSVSNISVEDLDKESFDIFRREALRSGRMTKKDLDISNEELLNKHVMVKFVALASAIVRDSKVPNRHDDGLNDGLNDGLEVGIENKVLSIIESNPKVTMAEISVQLSVTKRTVERTVKRLRENNRVERVGGKRYGHWVIHE